jgi:hypothetical protein
MGADWREVVLLEGTNGGRITRIDKQREWSSWWHKSRIVVNPQNGEPRLIHGNRWETRWRERVLPKLADRVETFRITQNRRDVPINIVNEGKPAVTSYLFAVHGWDFVELHEMLGLTGGTIRQYIMAVKNEKR